MDRQTDGEMLDHLVTCCSVAAGGHLMPAAPDTATIVHGVWHANDGTDGQTDGETLDRFIDPAVRTMQAVSVIVTQPKSSAFPPWNC